MEKQLNGLQVSEVYKARLKAKVETLKRPPHLVVILVGEQLASATYVRNKEKACAIVGFTSTTIKLAEDTSQAALLEQIHQCNQDETVDGILVQLPLPKHMNTECILEAIDPQKDVDGFHPMNVGRMMIGLEAMESCTPKGIIELLKYYQVELKGKHVVIVGRSNIVGKPLVPLFLREDASVSVVHSKSEKIKEITRSADVLVAAIGKAKLIDDTWIKEGAILIDVGINRDEQQKLCGDIDYQAVYEKCKWISPVPKGVGPMTICMLLENTMKAYQRRTNDGL